MNRTIAILVAIIATAIALFASVTTTYAHSYPPADPATNPNYTWLSADESVTMVTHADTPELINFHNNGGRLFIGASEITFMGKTTITLKGNSGWTITITKMGTSYKLTPISGISFG